MRRPRIPDPEQECAGLGGLLPSLLFLVLAPLLLSLLALAFALGRAWRRRNDEQEDERISSEDWRAEAWRRCLLPVLVVMFIATLRSASVPRASRPRVRCFAAFAYIRSASSRSSRRAHHS